MPHSSENPWVSAQARQLVFRILASWHRRGSSLLQIGLNDLPSPDVFWDAGFDVSALSDDPDIIQQARAQYSPKIDVFLGALDHAPFDDSAFDYVALVHCLGHVDKEKQEARMAEAFRLARFGVLVVEWNKFSPSSHSYAETKTGINPVHLYMLGKKHAMALSARYTLNCSPALCARIQKFFPRYNPCKSVGPFPVGALMCFKYDKHGLAPAPVAPVTSASVASGSALVSLAD